ncbi:MAG: hypothetical protein A2087_12565 [Spirochaetes bacterium GWD1_61_31]|nr:MAG: hypothetical protein A2Y37_11445 [Spirochaetes bacterium GWB1_60_80]OHD33030.1 MAG: hypothetical protein A2004_07340 [Spirochaetes bacterium GWC1_61_12]OHD38351.1 MAG: hypothetical protein A2087_12565 [Spirochaetes bacterium GWD1_61_31]OHD43382.1 MAG: hypothetical protein A2Y35_02215 [Spirochaetes bacterium GWE1_60_18]OHD58913.1 MAG: hypothetical protein A2Y32_10655 [Spirochaetes bacterium GWF1_60_12]HAX36359.1 hypothetical protein [Spirochaetaceae bacterium]
MKDRQVILIVDDQLSNIELLEAYLLPQGYVIVTATSGEEAVAKLGLNEVDLILLDVMMPGMNGFDLTAWIRQDPEYHGIPIILVTALRDTEHRIKGIEAGCDDFLSKPVDKMELLARSRSLLKVKAYNDLMVNYRNELEAEVIKRTEELNNLTVALKESNTAMRRFVPEQFLKQLGKATIEEVKLGDHTALNMTVMFADIRQFSSLSEKMNPEETFAFINQYLTRLGPPVRNHGGFIDKYIGDGIMALFPSSSEGAVRCAIDMHIRLADFNLYLEGINRHPIQIGIGLHEGCLMLGTIGENERMDGTVISDTVNTASRIEGISKQFGIGVAVSERILLSLDDPCAYHIRFIGKVDVKGRREAVPIFEVYDGDPEPLKRKKDLIKAPFERGVDAFYANNYAKARGFFNATLEELPDDQASCHYIRIMQKFDRS